MATKETKEQTPAQRLEAIGIETICEYVANGDSLRSWAIGNGFALSTVRDWIDTDEDRSAHYARARDDRADAVFDSLDDVSDQAVTAETAVEVAGLRLKSDNIKWKLARMNAKKYGDKLTQEITGKDGGPQEHIVAVRPQISREEWLKEHGIDK